MATKAAASSGRKRKQSSEHSDAVAVPDLLQDVGLEMLSEDEGATESVQCSDSDDGEVEEFPEINASSSEEDEEDEDEEDGEESEGENSNDTDDLSPFPKPKTIISDITGQPKRVYPAIEADYDSDSSTEDDPNRVGHIPMHWYDDMPHIGYDMDGRKVFRPAKGDELDRFLQTVDDPSSWTAAFDKKSQMDKPLTEEELDIIQRLQKGENPDAAYNPYEPTVEWFTGKGKEEIMPLSAAPEPKRRWVPSKWEKQKIMKIVRAIRQGRIVPSKPKTASTQTQFYAIWNETTDSNVPAPLPAPKPRLPTTAESYNPPEEYLPTAEERAKWESTEKEDREQDFLPRGYSSLRLVPGYNQFIQERFGRQLDLYLAPRVQRAKLNIDPESLVPKLPSPSSLRPFPNYRALGVQHTARVRAVSVSSDGAWVVSADEYGLVSLWEVIVGREVKRWKFEGKIGAVEWCPRTEVSFFVVGLDETLYFIAPPNLPASVANATQSLLAPAELPPAPATPSPVKWASVAAAASSLDKPILTVTLPPSSGAPRQLTWHRRGDYLASVCTGNDGSGGVWIHQLSRRHSQAPFKKIRGAVQLVRFHPSKPHFFVATQRYVRIYNLSEQKLLKTLTPGSKWISCMDIHPSGDHLIVGSYDRKLCWFDLELSEKPYKILRYHTRALRSLHFHPTYPLFASSSDDGSIQVFHARVYNDLMTDPLIVPLKILRGHEVKDGLGVLQVQWANRQPWLVSAGADGAVNVWCS